LSFKFSEKQPKFFSVIPDTKYHISHLHLPLRLKANSLAMRQPFSAATVRISEPIFGAPGPFPTWILPIPRSFRGNFLIPFTDTSDLQQRVLESWIKFPKRTAFAEKTNAH